jgi:hypothetical protein
MDLVYYNAIRDSDDNLRFVNRFLLQFSGQAENLLYGHLQLLANECGFDQPPFLNGHLQHGWNGSDLAAKTERARIRAKKFVWSERVAQHIVAAGGSNVSVIGSPWLYLLRQNKVEYENHFNSKGVIAYPDHSQPWEMLDNIHAQYSDYLKSKFGQVTVSLHWTDYSNIHIRQSYENDGHVVVTNGVGTPWLEKFNKNYLENQLNFLSSHKTFVSNSVTTPAFYASSLGLDIEIEGPAGWTDALDVNKYYGDFGLNHWVQRLKTRNMRSLLWREELGFDNVLKKNDLIKILGWDDLSLKPKVKFLFRRSQDILLNGSYKEKLSFVTK